MFISFVPHDSNISSYRYTCFVILQNTATYIDMHLLRFRKKRVFAAYANIATFIVSNKCKDIYN